METRARRPGRERRTPRRGRRRALDDRGLSTVEWVVLAVAVIGMALLVTAFLPGYLQGWLAQLPTSGT
ncbi:MAG: hypothetical protein ACFCVG_08835 [Kineosporiaceae bacterium]